MSKAIGFALILCGVLLGATAGARAADADDVVFAPMHQFADGMNSGDMKKAGSAYVASASIIDEFAPHQWNSFAAWLRDAGAYFKAGGVSDLHIALGAVSFKQIGAKAAYAVVPTTLTSKANGKPGTEKGLFTFSFVKGVKGWRISGWAWSTL